MPRRCAACPRPPGAWCVSRRHPPYCGLVAAEAAAGGRAGTGTFYTDFVRVTEPEPAEFRADQAPTPDAPLPPLWRQAWNLAGAVLNHWLRGRERSRKPTVAARKAICRSCEFLRAEDGRCAKCGCPIIGAGDPKAEWSDSACVLGRWGVEHPAAPPPARSVLIRSHLYGHGAYGQIAYWLGRSLASRGPAVSYEALSKSEQFLPLQPFVTERLRQPEPADWDLLLDVPLGAPRPGRSTVWFTMWEVDTLPAGAAARMNDCRAVVVPCGWNRDVLVAAGVRPELVRVVPLGVCPGEGFRPDAWPPPLFTVGLAGRLAHGGTRKNLAEGVRAWRAAFDGVADVRLRLKVFSDCLPLLPADMARDPRIEVDIRPLTPPAMADWTKRNTVLFVPSRGEGFGLHTLQSLACGRPVIAALATGTAEFTDSSCAWPLPWRWGPAGEPGAHGQPVFSAYSGGRWAVPEFEGMVTALRAAYDDWQAGGIIWSAKSAAAAARGAEYPWARTGLGLHRVLVEAGLLDPSTLAPREGLPCA